MSQQIINRGMVAGDGTGESGFSAFGKVNGNFTEVYTAIANIQTILGSDTTDLDTLQEIGDWIEANGDSLDSLTIDNIAGLQAALDAKLNAALFEDSNMNLGQAYATLGIEADEHQRDLNVAIASAINELYNDKVNISDIKDSLTSLATDKPLSAHQGLILKGLIDSLASTLANDIANSSVLAKKIYQNFPNMLVNSDIVSAFYFDDATDNAEASTVTPPYIFSKTSGNVYLYISTDSTYYTDFTTLLANAQILKLNGIINVAENVVKTISVDVAASSITAATDVTINGIVYKKISITLNVTDLTTDISAPVDAILRYEVVTPVQSDAAQDDATHPAHIKNKNRHIDITESGDLLQSHNDAILRFTGTYTVNLTALLGVDWSVNLLVDGDFTPTINAGGLTLVDADGNTQTSITLEENGYYNLHNYGDKFVINKLNSDDVSGSITSSFIDDFIPRFNIKSQSDKLYVRYNSNDDLRVAKIIDNNRCLFANFMTSDEMLYLKNYDVRDFTYNKIVTQNLGFTVNSGTLTGAGNRTAWLDMGGTISSNFVGDNITFHNYSDDRGAIWTFTLDGDTTNQVTVDTYGSSYMTTELWSNLPYGNHTVTGEVTGYNPDSTLGEDSRGWIENSDNPNAFTINSINDDDPITVLSTNIEKMLSDASVEEFAFKVNLTGEESHWIPNHGESPMMNNTIQIIRDDILIASGESIYVKCDRLRIIQDMDAFFMKDVSGVWTPQGDAIARVSLNWDISVQFFELFTKIKVLREFELNTAYIFMIPYSSDFASKMIDGEENNYDLTIADGSNQTITDRVATFYAYNDSKDLVSVATLMDANLSLNKFQNYNLFLNLRTSDVKKLYYNVNLSTRTVDVGEEFNTRVRFFAGLK